MKNPGSFFKRVPAYLLFLAVYPVAYLWLENFDAVHGFVVGRSLLISALLSAAAFLFFGLIFRSARRGGLLAGLWLLLFFTYGHVFSKIDALTVGGVLVGRHLVMIALWVLIGLTGSFFILRSKSNFALLTLRINQVCAFLTAALVLSFALKVSESVMQEGSADIEAPRLAAPAAGSLPQRDVYYLLLDGYDRPDLLKGDLDMDIDPFVEELKQLGFVMPACGQSNYIDTATSMAATLNMNYLDSLGYTYEEIATSNHELKLRRLLKNNEVKRIFREMGYKFISFKTPYIFVDLPDSDVYLDDEADLDVGAKLESLRFQRLFIETTFARTLAEWLEKNPADSARLPAFIALAVSPQSLNPEGSTFVGRNYKEYQLNVYMLEKLKSIPEDIPGPKIVYAHILVTHQPFTFTRSGEFSPEGKDSYLAYLDQVAYLNTALLDIIRQILQSSAVPPVIILQSDHSYSDGGKRALNFQAYYLPDGGGEAVTKDFTNVNTFRLVLSQYFGLDYPLLPNRSFDIDERFPEYVQTISPVCNYTP